MTAKRLTSEGFDMAKRGRPRLETPRTREELNARARESRERLGIKNVALDAECLELMHDAQKALSERFGFDLTLKQTIKHILKTTGGRV